MTAYYHHEGHALTKPEELPEGETYAVLQTASYSSDHGYPEHGSSRYPYCDIIVFPDKEHWLSYIQAHEKKEAGFFGKETIVPVMIRKAKMTVTVNVEVK